MLRHNYKDPRQSHEAIETRAEWWARRESIPMEKT